MSDPFIAIAHQNVSGCPCRFCTGGFDDNGNMYFVVCPTCGNKRCPHAEWHGYKCTGSNQPGQFGEPL